LGIVINHYFDGIQVHPLDGQLAKYHQKSHFSCLFKNRDLCSPISANNGDTGAFSSVYYLMD